MYVNKNGKLALPTVTARSNSLVKCSASAIHFVGPKAEKSRDAHVWKYTLERWGGVGVEHNQHMV